MTADLRAEGMDTSQLVGARRPSPVLTHDERPAGSAHHPADEPLDKSSVVQERQRTSGHYGDEDGTSEVTGEASADTRTESESIVTPTETPNGDEKATGQGTDHGNRPTMSRATPLSTLGEGDDLPRKDASQHNDSMSEESITVASGDGRVGAPIETLGEDENATTQDLPLVTSYEACSDPQHEAICAKQPATADSTESPSDLPAKEKKAVMAREVVTLQRHAREVEEGATLDLYPGFAPCCGPRRDIPNEGSATGS